MRNTTKGWLITAAVLTLSGLILFTAALMVSGWDFSLLSLTSYVDTTHGVSTDFNGITINTDTADIMLLPNDDEGCTVICHEAESMKHTVEVTDGMLNISITDSRKWYEYIILLNFDTPKITVYLPSSQYTSLLINNSTGDITLPHDFIFADVDVSVDTGDVNCNAAVSSSLKIKTSTGHVTLQDTSAVKADITTSTGKVSLQNSSVGELRINVSTGDVSLTNVTCGSFITEGNTGEVSLSDVICRGKMYVKRSTGDVKLELCDADELYIETDTGNVTGTLLTEKIFFTESDTGKIDVPKSLRGGKCEVVTDTGNIRFAVTRK